MECSPNNKSLWKRSWPYAGYLAKQVENIIPSARVVFFSFVSLFLPASSDILLMTTTTNWNSIFLVSSHFTSKTNTNTVMSLKMDAAALIPPHDPCWWITDNYTEYTPINSSSHSPHLAASSECRRSAFIPAEYRQRIFHSLSQKKVHPINHLHLHFHWHFPADKIWVDIEIYICTLN